MGWNKNAKSARLVRRIAYSVRQTEKHVPGAEMAIQFSMVLAGNPPPDPLWMGIYMDTNPSPSSPVVKMMYT